MHMMLRQSALRVARTAKMLPHGVHLPSDLQREFPAFDPQTVFDIGANVGVTVQQYLADFPHANVMAFEPDPDSYKALVARTATSPRVRTFPIGLSDQPCQLRFDNTSPVHQIHAIAENQTDERLPLIEFSTIDGICERWGVQRVGLVKIDVEGNELKVLSGAERMLRDHSIDVVFAECSLSDQGGLVPFENIRDRLRKYGYKFFGFYNQVAEATFAYANCAFISPTL